MNINQLKYFIAVAEERNFTIASKKLYITQPSLSQSIQNIEQAMGSPLFDRTTNPVELTPAGKIFLNWAYQVVSTQEETALRIQELNGEEHATLSIGTSAERSRSLVVPTIKAFREKHPNCLVEIYEVTASQLHTMLENDEIDLAIGKNEPDSNVFTSEHICYEYPVLAVPVEMAESIENDEHTDFDPKKIKTLPFVTLSSEQTYGSYFREYCTSLGFVPNIVAETRNLVVLHNLIRNGIGAGLVTSALVNYGPDHTNVRYYKISEGITERSIYVVHKNSAYLSEYAKSFISIIKNRLKLQ